MNEIVTLAFRHEGGRMVARVQIKMEDGSIVDGLTTMAPDMATIVAGSVNNALHGMLWHFQYPPAIDKPGPSAPDYGTACLMMARQGL